MRIGGVLYLHDTSKELSPGRFLLSKAIWDGRTVLPPVLVTTMWDCRHDIEQAQEEEKIVTKGIWKEAIEAGSKVMRFLGTRESAIEIVKEIMKSDP